MPEFIIAFIKEKEILAYIYKILIVSFGTLGMVYIEGRLLGILKTDKQKNRFAALCLFLISIGIFFYNNKSDYKITYNEIWEIFICGVLAAIPYVIFCWRLFDRMDSLLDRKGFRDRKKYRKS